jgi:hypothetical protein
VLPGKVGERLSSGAPSAVAVTPRGYGDPASRRFAPIMVAFGSPMTQLAPRAAHLLAAATAAQLHRLTVLFPNSPGIPTGEAAPEAALLALGDGAALEQQIMFDAQAVRPANDLYVDLCAPPSRQVLHVFACRSPKSRSRWTRSPGWRKSPTWSA